MSDFDTRQLRYFVETAKTGSMTQAARKLFVSQQALSKGITNLEAQLGAPLFTRDRSGVTLTAFGGFFLKRAKLSLKIIDLAGDSLHDFANGTTRTIAFGMPASCLTDFGGTLNAGRLYELQKAHPSVTFEFVETGSNAIRKRLENGSLQFGIGARMDERSYESLALGDFPFVMLVSRDNPLSRQPSMTPCDLVTGRVVIPDDDEWLKTMLETLGEEAGADIERSPIKMAPVDNAGLIVDRDTFVIMPEQHARRTTSTEHVALVPLVDEAGKAVVVSLCLNWRKSMPLAAPERALIAYISELYAHREG